MCALPLRRFEERETFEPRRQDPYRSQTKPRGHCYCPECGGIFTEGKWFSAETGIDELPRPLPKLRAYACPACRQLRDHYAMGVVEIHGEAWRKKEQLVLRTLERTEKVLRNRNDQERILWSDTRDGTLKFYVTLPELARQIGRTLQRSFKGRVEYARSTEEPFLRVKWTLDEKPAPRLKSRRNLARNTKSWRSRGAKRKAR